MISWSAALPPERAVGDLGHVEDSNLIGPAIVEVRDAVQAVDTKADTATNNAAAATSTANTAADDAAEAKSFAEAALSDVGDIQAGVDAVALDLTSHEESGAAHTADAITVDSEQITATDVQAALEELAEATPEPPTAADVPVDPSGFSGNLDENITDVQALAEAVDELETGGGGDSGLIEETPGFIHPTLRVGTEGSASGDGAVSVGGIANGANTSAVGAGSNATASGTAVGSEAVAFGGGAVALGRGAGADAFEGVAVGSFAIAEGQRSVALGAGVQVSQDDEAQIAGANLTVAPSADAATSASTLTLQDSDGDPHTIGTTTDGGLTVDGNPVGGGGAVDSVNGQTGTVVLSHDDVGAASAAQGERADTAVQPDDLPDLAPVATSGAYQDLSGKPPIPDALSDLGDVDTSGASSGDVLTYDGSIWAPETPSGGGGPFVPQGTQSGDRSLAVGELAVANGWDTAAVGQGEATANNSTAIGVNRFGQAALASGFASVGINGRATAGSAVAIGGAAEYPDSTALGAQSYGGGDGAVAIGRDAYAEADRAISIGLNAATASDDQAVIATKNLTLAPHANADTDASTLTLRDSDGDPHTIGATTDGGLTVDGQPLASEGAVILTGDTTPSAGLGEDGDFYLQTTVNTVPSWYLWQKIAGAWTIRVQMPKRAKGALDTYTPTVAVPNLTSISELTNDYGGTATNINVFGDPQLDGGFGRDTGTGIGRIVFGSPFQPSLGTAPWYTVGYISAKVEALPSTGAIWLGLMNEAATYGYVTAVTSDGRLQIVSQAGVHDETDPGVVEPGDTVVFRRVGLTVSALHPTNGDANTLEVVMNPNTYDAYFGTAVGVRFPDGDTTGLLNSITAMI